jgi:hypothetical protein
MVSRESGWEAVEPDQSGPILVATRNDDLAQVVAKTPGPRRHDLVFVQNGMLRPWLEAQGLAAATRGILRLAVASLGSPLVVGEPSLFVGPHAVSVASWFADLGISALAVDEDEFAQLELEKLVWICAMGLLCDAHACSVGRVISDHAAAAHDLVRELGAFAGREIQVKLALDDLWDAVARYSLTIPNFRASVKEWPWRNGWFVTRARECGKDLPLHHFWLQKAGFSALVLGEQAPA